MRAHTFRPGAVIRAGPMMNVAAFGATDGVTRDLIVYLRAIDVVMPVKPPRVARNRQRVERVRIIEVEVRAIGTETHVSLHKPECTTFFFCIFGT